MSKVLAAQVNACRQQLQAVAPNGRLRSLRLQEGTVELVVLDSKGLAVKFSMICEEPSAFPHSPALVFADQEGMLPDGMADRFSSGATLHDFITQVCQAMQVPTTESALQATISSAAAGAEPMSDDADEPGSDGFASDAMSEGSDDYGSGGAAASASEEEEDNESDANSDDEDRDMLMECGQRQGRWERHEAELEAAEAAKSQALSMEQAAASKRQIFSPKEAFAMLSKEVLDVFRQQDPNMYVDTHGNDVYTWNVWIGGFKPDSALAKDMLEVSRRFSQSTVHLRFSFKRGLHPFYPPAVEIIRPHLQARMPGAVASHPMLKLQNWDPWRRNVDVFKVLKDFLEAHGRVDVSHVRNSEASYPDSAYSPLQRGLARLESLTDAVPACWGKCREVYEARDSYDRNQASLAALQQTTKKRSRADDDKQAGASTTAAAAAAPAASIAGTAGAGGAEAPKPKAPLYWAQGTGYGFGAKNGPVWDPKAAAAAQEAQDAELQAVLSGLVTALAQELGGSVVAATDAGLASAPAAAEAAAAQRRASGEGASNGGEGDVASMVSAVADSVLLPFLVQQLGSASFTEMCSRCLFYSALLRLVQELCRPATQALLTQEQGAEGCSVAGTLRSMTSSARVYGDMVRKTLQQGGAAGASTSSAASAAGPSPAEEALSDARRGLELADLVMDISGRLDGLLGPGPGVGQGVGGGGIVRGARGQVDYMTAMKAQLVNYASISKGHHYLSASTREAGGNLKPRTVRVAKEIAGLERDLAGMTEASMILVRVDEVNCFLWKALITGPEDTPYSGGCFIFNIYFPPSYPSVALQCNLCTTGGGTIRFNPNLYNCGKVCLSLLGTWSGGQGEGWDPTCSTAKQVLVSIQSLILVSDPYFNEPGYERTMHSEQGKKASRDYNKVITEGTIARAMIDHLLKPPAEFKEAIELHFKLRGKYILDNIQGWIDDAKTFDSSHASRLKALRKQLQELISKLA